MKSFFLTFVIFVGFIQAKAQLTVDAGNDVTACFPDSIEERMQLGGNPTAAGGVEPYTYAWDGKIPVYYGDDIIKWIKASEFLDDTTKSNPTFKSIDTPGEWITFYLKVEDAAGNVQKDSVRIINAFILTHPIYMVPITIKRGDSIQFFGDIYFQDNGFQPLKYRLSPSYGLTDPTDLHGWAKPDTTTTYYLHVTNTAGCTASGYYLQVIVDTTTVSTNLNARQLIQCYLSGGDLVINLPRNQDAPYRVTVTTVSGALIHSGKFRERNLRLPNLNLKKTRFTLFQ
jgi:hypothetical protein